MPTTKHPDCQFGFDYSGSDARVRFYTNVVKQFKSELEAAVKNGDLLVGCNLHFDAESKQLTKYDFGLVHECCENFLVGLRHESTDASKLALGKASLFLYNRCDKDREVAAEWGIDATSKHMNARLGYLQKYSDGTSVKAKIDCHGRTDAVYKHQMCKHSTVSMTTGINLKDFVAGTTKEIPMGIAFDLKL